MKHVAAVTALALVAVGGMMGQASFSTLATFRPGGLCNLAGANGALYGTVGNGGEYGGGAVYKLMPNGSPDGPWVIKTVYSFPLAGGLVDPAACGVVIGTDGDLFVALQSGGTSQTGFAGFVVRLQPPQSAGDAWQSSTLHSFVSYIDGELPQNLVPGADGVLYGETLFGGYYGGGTAFELSRTDAGAWI